VSINGQLTDHIAKKQDFLEEMPGKLQKSDTVGGCGGQLHPSRGVVYFEKMDLACFLFCCHH